MPRFFPVFAVLIAWSCASIPTSTSEPEAQPGAHSKPCPFVSGGTVNSSEWTDGGAGSEVSVRDYVVSDGETNAVLEVHFREQHPFGMPGPALPAAEFTCTEGRIQIAVSLGAPIALLYDRLVRGMRLDPELVQRVVRLIKRPLGRAGALEDLRRMECSLAALGSRDQPVVGVRNLLDAVRFRISVEHLAADDWPATQDDLALYDLVLIGHDAWRDPIRREISAQVDRAKDAGAPLRLGELRSLGMFPGTVFLLPPKQLEHLKGYVFWRRSEVCIQTDTITCYDVGRDAWSGPTAPLEPLMAPEIILEYKEEPHDTYELVRIGGQGGIRAKDVVALGRAPNVVFTRNQKLFEVDTAGEHEPTPAKASASALQSSGTRLLGGGRYRLTATGKRGVTYQAMDSGRSWMVPFPGLRMPPDQEASIYVETDPPLASPDQKWLAAWGPPGAELHLFKVEPGRAESDQERQRRRDDLARIQDELAANAPGG